MKAPKLLTETMKSLGPKATSLRAVGTLDSGSCWTTTIPGSEAFRCWEKLREQASQTTFWPVIVNGSPGPSVVDVAELIKGWVGSEVDEEDTTRQSPEKILEEARALPFDKWVEQERDPEFQAAKYLRQAEFFDKLDGASSMAAHYREWAAKCRELKKEEVDPEACQVPPAINRNPPQQELSCVHWYDLDKHRSLVADSVTILFVPTKLSWEVPANLSYTTSEGNRPPSVHVAALKWLSDRFGADLVGLDPRIVELLPRSRPQGKTEAVLAAHSIRAYSVCPVTSENELASLEEMAFYLMESKYWGFCWP